MFDAVQPRSLNYSAALHIAAVALFVIGLPPLISHIEMPPAAISVEILTISERSNVAPSKAPGITERELPEVKHIERVPPATAKPAQVQPHAAMPKETAPDNSIKFRALMDGLGKESADAPAETTPAPTAAVPTGSTGPSNASLPLSINEVDAIRSQFMQCWTMPVGAPDPKSLVTRVRIRVGPDGKVIHAELASDQAARYASDPFFHAAADSALRAVWKCKQLENLPADRYATWSDMELTFDPSSLLY